MARSYGCLGATHVTQAQLVTFTSIPCNRLFISIPCNRTPRRACATVRCGGRLRLAAPGDASRSAPPDLPPATSSGCVRAAVLACFRSTLSADATGPRPERSDGLHAGPQLVAAAEAAHGCLLGAPQTVLIAVRQRAAERRRAAPQRMRRCLPRHSTESGFAACSTTVRLSGSAASCAPVTWCSAARCAPRPLRLSRRRASCARSARGAAPA